MFKATHKHDSFVRTLAAWPCSSFYQRMIQLQQLYTCHPSARHSQAVINDTCTNKVIGPTGDYMWWAYDECASHRIVCGVAVQWKGGSNCLQLRHRLVKTPAPPAAAAAAANWTSKYGEGEKNKNIQTPLSGRTFSEKLTTKNRRLQIFQQLVEQFKLGKQRFRNRCTCTYTKEPNCKAWPPALLRERIKQCAIKCWS